MGNSSTNDIRMIAVNRIEQGEKNPIDSKRKLKKFDVGEFLHLFISWLISGGVVFAVLICLAMAEHSTNLVVDVIKRIDMLSLMFSLILSAGLEQVWNGRKSLPYKMTQVLELALAFVGLMLYLFYSLLVLYDPTNVYLQERYYVNLCYIVLSIIAVIVGFIARAVSERRKGE